MAVASAGPSAAVGAQHVFRASPAQTPTTNNTPRAKAPAATLTATPTNGPQTNGGSVPLSLRKSQGLDLNTVERRGTPTMAREVSRSNRLFGLEEAPTYTPTLEEFKDPMEYMMKIAPEGRKYGIVKVVPPEGWDPDFAIDTERFHFRTRKQTLSTVEGGTRTNHSYLDQLSKFHRSRGNNLNKFPSVDKRPLDLFKLKKAVETRGGFERVCSGKKWAEIGRDLGYSGKIMSSLSTSLKNSYQKWLKPYEEYLRIAKPGVHQMLELENGGPFTPSPAPSPLKQSQQTPPIGANGGSPAIRASAALNASIHNGTIPHLAPEPQKPVVSSGFTAVNSGGFTAVNTPQPPAPTPPPTSSFSAINAPNGVQREFEAARSTPQSSDKLTPSFAEGTPEQKPTWTHLSFVDTTYKLPKRQRSEGSDTPMNGDSEVHVNGDSDASGRRSKRLRKDAPPTVAGSHMTQPRASNPRLEQARSNKKPGDYCENCGKDDHPASILICDTCDAGYHRTCLEPPPKTNPEYDWHCPRCLVGDGEFGFEEGGIYSLKQFQQKDTEFRQEHFRDKTQYDPVTNRQRLPSEDDVEREYWRLVMNVTDNQVPEVEYGADVHVTTHGSGFPTIEKNPRNPYSTDPWNLTVLPFHQESLFRHTKTDISGMTVPWLYVGMCFSTFCWHNEDHYAYSANYQHFGATKTWYGVPGEDAEKFEQAMREEVPELFETQPDLLFQLTTMCTPEKLKEHGVRLYAIDQRAGQFVITFPQAYHAGFNHGFNFNEAVNFAPPDWEPWGEAGVQRLHDFRRQPCFSHDELLLTAAASKDISIKTAKWLGPALEKTQSQELAARSAFTDRHNETSLGTCVTDEGQSIHSSFCELKYEYDAPDSQLQEEEYVCDYCKAFAYLSRFTCSKSGKVMCLVHAGTYECCESTERDRFKGAKQEHKVQYRMSNESLNSIVKRVVEKARLPDDWSNDLDNYLAEEPKPELKKLRRFLNDGEKIPWPLPALSELKRYVDRCNEWVEKATAFTTRKQQNRRKNERSSRKSIAKAAEQDERERELRKIENLKKLVNEAEDISFDCPEIATLQEHLTQITDFQKKAGSVLDEIKRNPERSTQVFDDLLELGRSFNVDIPEVDMLDKVLQQAKWFEEARSYRDRTRPLFDISDFIKRGIDMHIPETEPTMLYLKEEKSKGEIWEKTATEVMAAEPVNYQQLAALSEQAKHLPVSQSTLAKVETILKKQRDAQEQIKALYERSKDPDFRNRPFYKDVREAMEALLELNSKPAGTIDLEREQKRHEDWMRRGKKLFGKANAPLHILHQHMQIVEARNDACFDLNDQPRMPVEPASREHTPESQDGNGAGSTRDVFCICRKPEAGMMIECELCHEWYHGKCLKIARGKVKEDDKYTCPICDYRVKIPRDATRPKLEDLETWQDELVNLPFQPEEEQCLENIVRKASDFRAFISTYVNPLLSNPDELTTQRFYLRKLEGADILLAPETNFFRQELHKWAPVAPEPPPMVQHSLSTRKPRPTKQQKMMQALGISNPDDLPQHLRTKQHTFKNKEPSKRNSLRPPTQETSHTPPGLPHGMSLGESSTAHGAMQPRAEAQPNFSFDPSALTVTSTFSENPMTAAFDPFTQNSRASPPFNPPSPPAASNMDPAIFGGGPFGASASPSRHMFQSSHGSSQGQAMTDIFADFTTHDDGLPPTSHAEDALAATAAERQGNENENDDDLNDFIRS
ncbi:histone demethylase JARID1D [Saccharata proteae CBS 121410]|uniref:Histone demethylase JARID1D n=1 Tax=Saccharata proteae CBS 121410 TaxID=1314787 RepID=A0A9P4I084_9PEZI|nr:histone demethylase JARID1D [Saccharata proteae CBS 121410]